MGWSIQCWNEKKNMKYSDRAPIIGVNDFRIELTKKKNIDKCQYNLEALHEKLITEWVSHRAKFHFKWKGWKKETGI